MAEKQTSKDRMREIVDSIENGIKELFESDKYRKYLATMSRFHRYSVNNTMLIYMQRPDATHVAGFNKWRDQFGRNVLKGEKGIRIIAPTPYKKKVEEIKTDPETNAPVLDADGKAIIEEKEMLNVDVETPFYRMPWDEAMGRFGSDKPDTRFGLEIQDVTEVFRGTEFKPFAAVLEAGGTIRAINAKGLADKLSRKNIDKLGEVAKTYGAKGLAYSRLTADGTSSSFEKFLTDAEKAALYAALNAETGDVLLLVSDTDWVKACTALGQVRLDIARKHGLIDPDKFNFLWVVDFPLFEYSEQEGRWMAMHHPFTLPKAEDLDKVESDPGACHAVAYDIVLNGVEMGGGSMRINDPALQDRMFHALGFTEEKARESFGFLMDAYKFGAPPHGGMAYGLDRMVMLMLKKDSIRDVIAFPKVQNAGEPMSGAPDVVDEQQLKDLSIALTLKD